LSTIDTDIKGDAFEYFIEKYNSTNNDLGEYFTPRHLVKFLVDILKPKFGEKIYDSKTITMIQIQSAGKRLQLGVL